MSFFEYIYDSRRASARANPVVNGPEKACTRSWVRMSYQGICRYGRASDVGQSSGQRSLGPSRAAATWRQQMRLTATHRSADVITDEVGRLPAFTPLVSIAGAVVVAVNMVPSFESAGGQPGLGPGFVLAEGVKIGIAHAVYRPPRVTLTPAFQLSQPVAHLPICPDGPFPGQ